MVDDVTGAAPDFTEENCLAFFRALPSYIFDPFRNWCSNPRRFVKRPKAVDQDKARKLGNA